MRTKFLSRSILAIGFLLLLPATGMASQGEEGEEESEEEPAIAESSTDVALRHRPTKMFSAGLAMDFWFPRDENVTASFSERAQIGWGLTFGLVPWSKYVHTEISLGVGHRVKRDPPLNVLGSSESSTSTESSESTESSSTTTSLNSSALLSWPLQLDLMVGVDILDEQPIVPYGRLGLDMLAWTSRTDDEDIRGMRGGWHWAVGIARLLDAIIPRRAAQAQASTGVDDAFITFEYRKVSLNNFGKLNSENRLDFGGSFFRTELHIVF